MKHKAVKGMRDLIGSDAEAFSFLEDKAKEVFSLYGFGEIRTPLLEEAALFHHGVGADTDIVGKEMYAFEDRGGEMLALRPEGTAAVVRSVINKNLHRSERLIKLFYTGAMFRRERPQKGRYRQFHQIGVEYFGAPGPDADLEAFLMLSHYFAEIGLTDVSFQLNSIGCNDTHCRPGYKRALRAFLEGHKERLCEDCQRRMATNPLRVLDCKVPGCTLVTDAAPKIHQSLCSPCEDHFDELRALLSQNDVIYELNHRLVRGLDYYSRTVFEVYSANLGAQSAAGGGGRFDGLFEIYGEKPIPAIGFALGLDRLAMLTEKTNAKARPIFVVGFDRAAVSQLVGELRRAGHYCLYDPLFGSMKSQFKQAGKADSKRVFVLGEAEMAKGEISLKDMDQSSQVVIKRGQALAELEKLGAA